MNMSPFYLRMQYHVYMGIRETVEALKSISDRIIRWQDEFRRYGMITVSSAEKIRMAQEYAKASMEPFFRREVISFLQEMEDHGGMR